MRKQLLTIALLAAFVSPAAAQTIYEDDTVGVPAQGTYDGAVDQSVDDIRTGSIAVEPVSPEDGACERGAGIDPSSNPQCNIFGGNSN